jgi:hypothetical protein
MIILYRLKKIIKIILTTAASIFFCLLLLFGLTHGVFGLKAATATKKILYSIDVAIYNIKNPEDLPSTEITVDLEKGAGFALNNITDDKWFFDDGMGYNNERVQVPKEKSGLWLRTFRPKTVEYFKINIIHKDTKLTINNIPRMSISFYDEGCYLLSESTADKAIESIANRRIDVPLEPNEKRVNGVSTVEIDSIGEVNEKGERIFSTDYEFVLKQNQRLAKMFDNKFERDPVMAEKRKVIFKEIWGDNYIDCKAWPIGDFYIYLELNSSPSKSDEYSNNINVVRTDESEYKLLKQWLQ